MSRLFLLITTVVVPTVAGMGIVVALIMGADDARSIIIASVIGGLLGLPASWFAARKIEENDLDIQDDV